MQHQPLKTTGQIADENGVPLHRVLYVLSSRRIKPAQRVGRLRVFDAEAQRQIVQALAETESAHLVRPTA